MKQKNTHRCRYLRENQTDAEKRLWLALRDRQIAGAKFRRQFPINGYILDFYCPEYQLGIEADGGGHYEDKGKKRDRLRTGELSKLGIEIIRFSDSEILKEIKEVCEVIYNTIMSKRG
ncbi:MAG: endonuclease domain-containing protein [Candidatus Omnitrophica bacterium]|nr:endonuclease domain-containing protein [Candidatus Omnitrophota bacterium]